MIHLLALMESVPPVGPFGWVFFALAVVFAALFTRLWYSISNHERMRMERELKQGSEQLAQWRAQAMSLEQRNQELAAENQEIHAAMRAQAVRLAELERANELLRTTEQQQSLLITALTERCTRNEKLILKLYTDLGKDIDLRHVGGSTPPSE